jgi:hypothetical protein
MALHFTRAREGRIQEHLARLSSLCFFPCEEYSDLKRAVEAYEKSGGSVKPAAAR